MDLHSYMVVLAIVEWQLPFLDKICATQVGAVPPGPVSLLYITLLIYYPFGFAAADFAQSSFLFFFFYFSHKALHQMHVHLVK